MKEVSIRKVIHRKAMQPYSCQCQIEGCEERIAEKEEYALFKIVEKLQGERKNKERKISYKCEWYKKWREFFI